MNLIGFNDIFYHFFTQIQNRKILKNKKEVQACGLVAQHAWE